MSLRLNDKLLAGLAASILLLVPHFGIRCVFAGEPMVALHNGSAAISSGLSPIGAAASSRPLQLEVRLMLRNRDQLNQLLKQQQDPASAGFHHWLTPAQFSSQFGPSPSDLASVTAWLASSGFSITSVDQQQGLIKFTGTMANAARVFATSFNQFAENHYAPSTDPMIPARFEGVIGSIHGLDNLLLHRGFNRLSAPTGKVVSDRTGAKSHLGFRAKPGLPAEPELVPAAFSQPQFSGAAGLAFAPLDLQTFYNSIPLLGSGNNGMLVDCIAFAEDSDFLTSAVELFSSTFGLPAPLITRVFPDGSNPGINRDELEALLDLQWAHAAAPGAPLTAYLGNGATALEDALGQIVRDNACGTVEMSFGFCGGASSFYSALDSLFSQAAAQGQSIFISSGDAGAAGLVLNSALDQCVPGTSRNVSEAAASTNVTAVGGTQFTPNYDAQGNNVGNVPESVWDDPPVGAGGGGVSIIFPKPAYQQNAPGVPPGGFRDLPDLSFGASPSLTPGFYIAIDDNGVPRIGCCVGGTSLSTAVMAGFSKLLAQRAGGRVGNINPRLYQLGPFELSAGVRDVTSGNNSFNGVTGFNAVAGYDQASGWGSIDVSAFVDSYTASAALVASPMVTASAAPGQTLSAGNFQVNNTGPSPIAIASITVAISDPAVFASLSLSASGSSNQSASASPASSTTFLFSTPVSIPPGGSGNFALGATVSLSPAMLSTTGPIYAAIAPLPSSPRARLGLLCLPLGILLMPVRRHRRLKIVLALAGLLAIGSTPWGCGGGGGGAPLGAFSSTQSVRAGALAAGGAMVSGLPADLSKITAL